jgi:hypothetical protein
MNMAGEGMENIWRGTFFVVIAAERLPRICLKPASRSPSLVS